MRYKSSKLEFETWNLEDLGMAERKKYFCCGGDASYCLLLGLCLYRPSMCFREFNTHLRCDHDETFAAAAYRVSLAVLLRVTRYRKSHDMTSDLAIRRLEPLEKPGWLTYRSLFHDRWTTEE